MRWLRRSLGAAILWRLFGPVIKPRFRPPQEHPWRLPGRTIFVGDEEFLVREAGPEEGEPIVLIHGLGGSSLSEWYLIAPKLATDRRVIMIDHRGHGLSTRAGVRFDVEDVADDIAGVFDELAVGDVAVVGYSMGGTIAQALVRRHPGRVSRLVLIATLASHPREIGRMRRVGALLIRAWERLTGLGVPEVRTGYLLTAGAVEPKHARWLWEETHTRHPDPGAQASAAVFRFDSTAWVGRLGVDTLVIIPTGDLLVPPAWQYELAGLIPGAKIVEIVGARHEVVWSHPDVIVDELTSFLVG